MTWLRHAARHVHHSAADYLQAQLEALDWMDPDETPFGAPPVKIRRTAGILGNKLADDKVVAGTVAITLGSEVAPDEQELGGPLSAQEYPLFIDIFQDSDAAVVSLATDVRDIFMGRMPNSQRWLPVTNQITGAVVPGWKLEFEDIERVTPDATLPLHWQVVKVTATAFFPEVTY